MNLYELAVVETEHALNQFSGVTSKTHAHRMACAVVDQLVAQGIIQSTYPGNLVPGGLTEEHGVVHKATPPNGTGKVSEAVCRHCGVPIKPVPGGSGPTWVHAETGAVAGSGGPR